ncbi:MAG: RlmE family RNA methyltransferase, partial [Candidatus Caldarchaeum sp.]|nr:RlmE family RNA methyltransferase [Candidatus Caldarchaeum sp.]
MAGKHEMTKEQWLQRRREDPFWRKAKEMGYPSRAAFKLLEIQKRWRIIKPGDKVLDLGAAPGGMTAVASDIVGDQGIVVAVDLEPIQVQRPNISYIEADVREMRLTRELESILKGELFDTVVSDLSPHHSGDYDLLVEQQLELLEAAWDLTRKFLRKGGSAVLKAFEHPSLRTFEKRLARSFRKLERYVPTSSKRGSSEIFLIALGYRGVH